MFQSRKQRKTAEEQHICEQCDKKKDCVAKPEETEWRWVLEYCQWKDRE